MEISFFDVLSMPNDDLKSIRQKLCKHYSLLNIVLSPQTAAAVLDAAAVAAVVRGDF